VKTLRNKNKAGFTLIELLVVIAIIGLLASVVLLALNSARAKSRDAKRLADIRQMASAFELFFNDKSSYPTNGNAPTAFAILSAAQVPGLVPGYIGIIPTAPAPPDGACGSAAYSGNAAGANDYLYAGTTSGVNLSSVYTLTFCLGQATGGYTCPAAGGCVHTLTPAGIQ
jgi:prepilin-type N-terminal cleavage/methylation domain-containing protein